eukprot:6922309-Pyramimonas_sp.AAC.1
MCPRATTIGGIGIGGGCIDPQSPIHCRWGPPRLAQEGAESLSGAHHRSIGDASPIPGRCVSPCASPPPMVAPHYSRVPEEGTLLVGEGLRVP